MSPPKVPSPRRGETYWLDFAPATGHEMTGFHPCVIVQNDVGNQNSALTIVVALTSNLRVATLPIGVLLPAGTAGLKHDSVVHCGHIYTVDQKRSGNKLGEVPAPKMVEIDRALGLSFGLKP